jgi:PAS domain S-box-containing protein
MIGHRWTRIGKLALFAITLLVASAVREDRSGAVTQAVIWLPTGVAIAGLWLLGFRACWVVALCTVIQRQSLGNEIQMALPAALGSTCEAVLGVLVLRRLGFRASLARLQDVLAIFAAAAVAPLGSILFSWFGRSFFWTDPHRPFYSGWDGWWRMNALGVMTAVPLILTWFAIPVQAIRVRTAATAAATAVGIVGLLLLVMLAGPGGVAGVLLLNLALLIALYAAVRFGSRGAASAGALAAIGVAFATTHGLGPFLSVALGERHVVLQLFELSLVAVPLVFGALIAERQAALARGVRSEELRHSTQEALPDVTFRLRQDGLCLDLYFPAGMAGPFARDEVLGRHACEFLPAGAADRLSETIHQVLAERTAITVEFGVVLQGRRRTLETRCAPYGGDDVLAVVRDITDRKWLEESMAFEARVLELVATGRPTTEIFAAIVSGMEQLTEEGLCSITVLDGKRMHVAMAPSLPAAYNAQAEGVEIGPDVGSCGAAASLGANIVVEDIMTAPVWDKYKHLALPFGLRACWSVPIHDSEGAVLGTFAVYYREPRSPEPRELASAERAGALAGIALDRERRGEALRRSEDLLASINHNVNEGLYRSTPAGELIYANLALARMFGYDTPDEILALAPAMPYEDPARREDLKRLAQECGHVINEEARFRRRDGTVIWGLISCTSVLGPGGVVAHFDGAIADVTQRKNLEEQLRQSQKMEAVGKLAGGVAHDFNNLLTAIIGYAEAIRDGVPATDSGHAHAEEVLTAAGRAAGLTRQLLAYSRQQVLSPQVIDLTVVVEDLGFMLRRLIGEDIGLEIANPTGKSWVRVDRGQLEQVILNLVVNARDAMPSGGKLTIDTIAVEVDEALAQDHVDLHVGPYVALSVRDTGTGMPGDVRARAFDPFFTTKEPGKGTGLGLSTVYGIVKQSGGAVWLDSQIGAGTTAWIYLPRVAAAAVVDPVAVATPAPATPTRNPAEATVLLAEDEPVVRDLVRRILEQAGYRVLDADDGVRAIEVSQSYGSTIDLVVTDVIMPRMGGRELADQLLAQRPGLRVLFISGYPNEAWDWREFAGPTRALLQKPFAPSELVEKVHALLQAG